MRLIINTTNLSKGGGLQVANSFIRHLKADVNTYCLLLSAQLSEQLKNFTFPENCQIYRFKSAPTAGISGLKVIREMIKIEKSFKPDVVFSVFGPSYWTPKAPHLMGYAIPHFVYKDSPFFDNQSLKQRARIWVQKTFKTFLIKRNAQYFVTETQDVKERFGKVFDLSDKRVFVVNNYYHQVFDNYQLNHEYEFISKLSGIKLVCISAFYPHKNLSIIKQVLDHNTQNVDIKFILTIPDETYKSNFSGYEESVVNIGPVAIEDCPSVYHYADFLFLPTLLECFTASYAEAMKMQKPILTSDLSFARGICGEAALYFQPTDPVDILEKIQQLSLDNSLHNKLITEGTGRLKSFPDSEERMRQYLSICNRVNDNIETL